MKGTIKGQINSVYKDRETNIQKVGDFKSAVENRDIHLRPAQLAPQLRQKLSELGVPILKREYLNATVAH